MSEAYVQGAFGIVEDLRRINLTLFKSPETYMFVYERNDEQIIVTNVDFKNIRLPYSWYINEDGFLTNKHKFPNYEVYRIYTLKDFTIIPYDKF